MKGSVMVLFFVLLLIMLRYILRCLFSLFWPIIADENQTKEEGSSAKWVYGGSFDKWMKMKDYKHRKGSRNTNKFN